MFKNTSQKSIDLLITSGAGATNHPRCTTAPACFSRMGFSKDSSSGCGHSALQISSRTYIWSFATGGHMVWLGLSMQIP